MMKREKSCGAIVWRKTEDTHEILLIKSRKGGFWGFPKGHVEKNETEIQTASREVFEEIGITPNFDKSFRRIVTYSPYPAVLKDVVYFTAEADHSPISIATDEVYMAKWFPCNVAIHKTTFDGDKKILKEFLKQKFLKPHE